MDKMSHLAGLQEKAQAELKKQADYLMQVENAIKKLRRDKKITQTNILRLEGLTQGYSDSVLLERDTIKEGVTEAAASV